MRKIPTLFRRDPEDLRRVTREVHPACQWVLDGQGVPTRKYDGTCVRLDESGEWWARREVKAGKSAPAGFEAVQTDPETGKTVGWEPVAQSAFAKFFDEAREGLVGEVPGTYELCGPKVNGDPEQLGVHRLVRHATAEEFGDVPRDFDGLMTWLLAHPEFEGVVWHHRDGRMAKLKYRDAAAVTTAS
ncbi:MULTISPECIES: DUF5565 family protein [unclassified Amycolatopsis]|uniref:RNA ligase 1 family protein n=1 Tax=unclassified Amycolatopsis TaxID=2618356 RepID=UPI001FF33A10|nr:MULTISPECIES: DUF5565 family protein [unclassified Amycolatopsis]UOZ10146.1 DUF5565 family protein [Amycolatopsis sp. WQ 127309]